MKNIQLIDIHDELSANGVEPTNQQLKQAYREKHGGETISDSHIVNTLGAYKIRKNKLVFSKEIEVFGSHFLKACGTLAAARIVLGLISQQS